MEPTRNYAGTKAVFKFSMTVVLILWLFMWFMRPLAAWQKFWKPVQTHTLSKSYANGAYIVVYAAPVIFVGFAGALGYHHKRRQAFRIKGSALRSLRSNPWTYPLFTKGPLSIISAADFIFLSTIVIFTVYFFTSYYITLVDSINKAKLHEKLWEAKLETAGTVLGLSGMFCLAILFFPVTRGSTILKLLNVPFEHAVKFHIWIAVVMLVTFTAHGVAYIIYWIIKDEIHELWSWHRDDISGLSGLIALLIGLVMWITSLGWVRKRYFELFYYTHHLYVLFILFYGLHLGDRLYMTLLGGALLFLGSRLMRSLQSQQTVDVLSARLMSRESVELVFAKHPDLHYSAASFVFLNLPAISKLQWHPFTVISSSNVEPDRLTLLIKTTGDWTSGLRNMIENAKSGEGLQLQAGVEGPYGQNLDYLTRYEALVFIAGGSGVSPFVSLLKEILYNIQTKRLQPPEEIVFIYSVKTSDELNILTSISPLAICPEFAENLRIQVHAYVTRVSGVDLEANKDVSAVMPPESVHLSRALSTKAPKVIHAEPSPNSVARYAAEQVRAVCPPLAANGIVEAAVILASFLGFMFLAGIIGRFCIYPYTSQKKAFARSVKGFLAFLETVVGVLVAGGTVAVACSYVLKKRSKWIPQGIAMSELCPGLTPEQVHYGRRPDLQKIFLEHTNRTDRLNVGVFVCGPQGMQEDVARLCQEYRTTRSGATYNYHSLNFDL